MILAAKLRSGRSYGLGHFIAPAPLSVKSRGAYGKRSKHLERRLLELAASSKSLEEVAHLMRRSPAAIYKMAIRLGVPLRPVELGLKATGNNAASRVWKSAPRAASRTKTQFNGVGGLRTYISFTHSAF
jgi:hypothetical protein